MGTVASGGNGRATIFRGGLGGTNLGSGTNGIGQAWAGASSFRTTLTLTAMDSPGPTSAQAYMVGFRSDSGQVDFIPAGTLATIVLTEIR